jgi:hypothetical protein
MSARLPWSLPLSGWHPHLLGNPDELDKKKHEIRHDMQRGKTTITDITTVNFRCVRQ